MTLDPKGLEAGKPDWSAIWKKVLPFAGKAKTRMQKLGKRRVRFKCPEHDTPASEGPYVTAVLAGRRDHLHMACEDPACVMRMME
jgi:hypothetical protein